MAIRVAATAHSRLSAAELFNLLADPRGCMTWHDHPEPARPQSTDAPPGLALAGAEYWTRGVCGQIGWRALTTVTAAEPSRHYATATETIYSHPRAPRLRSRESFVLEDEAPRGCIVRYETDVSRDEAGLGWYPRTYFAVVDRLLMARALRRNFHHVLKAAESAAARSISTRM